MNRLYRLLRLRKVGEGIERGRFDRARLEVAARRAEADALAAKRGDSVQRASLPFVVYFDGFVVAPWRYFEPL